LRALQEFRGLNFWKGTAANFDGHFMMKSYHTKLVKIKKELKEATVEFPKYQVTDCWIDRFEFENYNYEHIKMLFSM